MNKIQYTEHTTAPFRSDGWGINDADGQRIAKVTELVKYVNQEEFEVLTTLFAAAPEMQMLLAEIHGILQRKGITRTKVENAMMQSINEVLIKSNKDYKLEN